MTGLAAIGRHAVWQTDDVIEMQFHGTITQDDVEGMRVLVRTVLAERSTCFLIADMHHGTGIEPEARRYMAQWSKERTEKVSGCAIYGVGGPMRAILKLTLAAIKLLGAQQIEIVFMKDEAEARQWIAAQRPLSGPGDRPSEA